jgi:hypothetical protein
MLIIALAVLLAAFLMPGMVLGAPETDQTSGFKIEGESNGLLIESPDDRTAVGNLNPGDLKRSALRLTNNGSVALTVYIRTEITGEKSPRGGKLADIMTLTIREGGTVYSDGTFREAHQAGM